MPSYEEVLLSGYTDGYQEGYKSAPCYKKTCLTIEALEDGSITVNKDVMYSVNDGPWQSAVSGDTIAVQNGDAVKFKGTNAGKGTFVGNHIRCIVYGNAMSLIHGDDFEDATSVGWMAFNSLFQDCTGIINAGDLILPATTLGYYCYEFMFRGCSSLEVAPELPATTLADSCYHYMFSGCTALETAPELPATLLDGSCYRGMFSNCTSLLNAPALPATTLANNCYDSMFQYCSSLEKAPDLLAETLARSCYMYMFYKCSSLNYVKCMATDITASTTTTAWLYGVASEGVFIHPCGVPWEKNSYNGVPMGWTEIDNCPSQDSRFNAVYHTTANNKVKVFGDSGRTAFSKVELEDGTDITLQITQDGYYTASQSGYIRMFLTPANTGETEVFAYAFGKYQPFIPHSGGANLYSIVIPDGYTSIGEGSFSGCNDLSEVVLPGSITTVKSMGFCCCYDLDIELPNTLTEIGRNGFSYCTSITSLTIPSGVTYIESLSFECIGVQEIVVPATVTVVDSGAFSSCENLTSVTIGNNVRYVGDGAFLNCSGITEMIFEKTSPPMIGSISPLGQTEYTFPIYVPDASVDAYKEHMDWVDYASRVKGISERQ